MLVEKLVKIPQRFNQLLTTVLLVLWLVLSMPAHAQQLIEVGGELTENTTWTNEFTYIVIDDLIVPEGVELVIMPGVKVQFYANRGLFVEQGSLKVFGAYESEIDTVRFELLEGQLWKGISLNKVEGENTNVIDHAFIEGGEIGIRLVESTEVVVSNSSVLGGVTNILIDNSSNNLIYNNHFGDNGNVAMDISAIGFKNVSAENRIENNQFSNSRYTNLRVRFENNGACPGNQIINNHFTGADVGLFIGNSDFVNNDSILIQGNVFYDIGTETFGYSISSGMDNTIIKHNIFWQNTLAIELRRGNQFDIRRNSFYQNKDALAVRRNANNVSIIRNTFTGNSNYVISFHEGNGLVSEKNNILNNSLADGIMRNQTADDIDISFGYWGTTDSTAIAAMMYDFYNDETLGKLHFNPYLEVADTISPVSPPHQVYLQLKNGQTRLSWKRNPEQDILGYAVYQGDMLQYQFEESPIIVSDTILWLSGDQTGQEFAVTAFDMEGYGLTARRFGHESPYAFAVGMPFAGADTAICSNIPEFEIIHSTVPFAFESLFWTTNGDGVFNNDAILRPVYTPGPLDKENGAVRLSLNVMADGILYQDSFKLTLSNIPEVFAGFDLIIPLTDSVILSEAEASHFEHLEWTSLGDGVFSNPNHLNPVYYFGTQDIFDGQVQMVLTASSACGIVTDTIAVFVRAQFTLEGKVLSQNHGIAGAAVLAFTDLADDRMQTAALTQSNADGSYRFGELFAADYLIYAVQDTMINDGILPTFYVNKLDWQEAYRLPLLADTYHVELELQKAAVELPEGYGRLSGRFILPDELNGLQYYCQPWFEEGHASYCDGGLSNVSILLYNDTHEIPLASALTDANGRFYFEQLPFGRYFISAEIPGYEASMSSLISLSPDKPERHDISLQIENDFKIGVIVPDRKLPGRLQLYPNPAGDYIHLLPEHDTEDLLIITLYSLQGQPVKQWEFQQIDSSESLRLFVGGMASGSYLLQLRTTERVKTYPVLIGR